MLHTFHNVKLLVLCFSVKKKKTKLTQGSGWPLATYHETLIDMLRCAVSTHVSFCVSAYQPEGGHSRDAQSLACGFCQNGRICYTPINSVLLVRDEDGSTRRDVVPCMTNDHQLDANSFLNLASPPHKSLARAFMVAILLVCTVNSTSCGLFSATCRTEVSSIEPGSRKAQQSYLYCGRTAE